MTYLASIYQQAQGLVHQRQRELSLLHVMLFWADQELDKIHASAERSGVRLSTHESKLDPFLKNRLKVVLEALKISPVDIAQVEKFSKLLEENSRAKAEADATNKEIPD